mgnify:CR=1 FL=1
MARRPSQRTEFERQALVHLNALYGAGYRLTRNPRDAEDLVQDTLVRAYRFWDSFQAESNCKAWLLRILTNTFINEYRRKQAAPRKSDFAEIEDAFESQLAPEAAGQMKNPEEEALANVFDEDVQRALDLLPQDYRMAVLLADIEGFSYREIAEILEIPIGTVMSRLHRGRKALQKRLLDYAVNHGLADRPSDPAPTVPSER